MSCSNNKKTCLHECCCAGYAILFLTEDMQILASISCFQQHPWFTLDVYISGLQILV